MAENKRVTECGAEFEHSMHLFLHKDKKKVCDGEFVDKKRGGSWTR